MARKPPATPKPKRPVGRPRYEPTDRDREIVTLLCAGGITQDRIAKVIGVGESTIKRHFAADIEIGQMEIDKLSISALVVAMRGGGSPAVTAATWWQKSRMGWRGEQETPEYSRPVPSVRVVVQLVGDPAPEQAAPRRFETGPAPLVRLVG